MSSSKKNASSQKDPESSPPQTPDDIPIPPDGGWGWVVVLSSFVISMLVDGVCFSQGIFFTVFMEYFQTNKATTSMIGSVLNGSYLTIGPFVSMLVNKYGCRRIAVIGAVFAWISLFASTFSPDIKILTFLYSFLGGTGFGLMYLPAIVMVGYYFDKRRALATGIACCGSGIGMFVFAPLSEYLLTQYNWKGATWIMSALVLNGAIFSMFYRPLPANKQPEVKEDTQLPASQENGKEKLVRCRSFETNLNAKSDLNAVKELDIARLAHSHDGLYTKHEHHHKHHFLHPLERKDIFYSGSVRNLKEFTEAGSEAEFSRSMMRSRQSLHSDEIPDDGHMTTCARAGRAMLTLFDISLLRSPTFLLYGISCTLVMLGFFIPFTYIPPLATDLDISLQDAAFLISIIGITNTIGRVAVGFISDQPWADCLLINNVALIVAGVVTTLVPFFTNYALLAAYVAVFGLGIAVFVSLRSIIMVELMGLERLTSAFGLVIMFQGVSSYIGAPIAGSIADVFGSYDAAFYLSGATLAMSGVICLPLRKVAAWEKRREKKKTIPEAKAMLTDDKK